ncbi:MAG: prepilin-type N-terminal cleavage/methylation domain-containing protein [Desulfobacterales bacterium]|nr:prepilin-type N-terminal cleavage/methylation domain-containing protein [Desulfobacterales bacterium]
MKTQRIVRGFTLIEVMVVIAIIVVSLTYLLPSLVSTHIYSESEIALQRALRILQSEVEILRAMPFEKLENASILLFDPAVDELSQLVAGRGTVTIKKDSGYPGILLLRAEVHWRDPRTGMRSVHTVLLKAGEI